MYTSSLMNFIHITKHSCGTPSYIWTKWKNTDFVWQSIQWMFTEPVLLCQWDVPGSMCDSLDPDKESNPYWMKWVMRGWEEAENRGSHRHLLPPDLYKLSVSRYEITWQTNTLLLVIMTGATIMVRCQIYTSYSSLVMLALFLLGHYFSTHIFWVSSFIWQCGQSSHVQNVLMVKKLILGLYLPTLLHYPELFDASTQLSNHVHA